jgi:hypothetical protein
MECNGLLCIEVGMRLYVKIMPISDDQQYLGTYKAMENRIFYFFHGKVK